LPPSRWSLEFIAGTLALIQAQRQPEKARELRLFSLVHFGMANLMAVMFFV